MLVTICLLVILLTIDTNILSAHLVSNCIVSKYTYQSKTSFIYSIK